MLYLELLKLLYDLVAAGFSLRSNSESKPIVVRITQPKNCGYALVPLSLFFFEENPGKGGLCQENRPDPMFYVLKVAQIDHLLINRFFDIYVLESKNFLYGLKITDTGEFLVNNGKTYFPIESPIEQNKRHQIVLEQVIKKYDIMPKRIGVKLTPSFYSYVIVSPKSRVVRPDRDRFDTSMVIKTDTLRTTIDKKVDEMNAISVLTTVSKISSFETVVEVAKRLAALHRPFKTDYRKRFGIKDTGLSRTSTKKATDIQPSKQFYCFKCKKPINEQVAKSCWDNNQRFHGRTYCFDCQEAFPGQR